MSYKYSCIKNKFTKRSIYIEVLKNPNWKKIQFLYKKRQQNVLLTQKKKKELQERFLKTNKKVIQEINSLFRHGFQPQIDNTV